MSFEVIHPGKLKEYLNRKDVILVDVRDRDEYLACHLEGAVNIPYEELSERSKWLIRYPTIIFYCERGNISLMAARDLKDWENHVITVSGGLYQLQKMTISD